MTRLQRATTVAGASLIFIALSSPTQEPLGRNDPARMRAALGQVQTHISGMNEKMDGCMKMMDGERGHMDR